MIDPLGNEEIIQAVKTRYNKLLNSSDAFSRATIQRIGLVNDVWDDYVWPTMRTKIIATLKAASREVNPRPRTFEFLGSCLTIFTVFFCACVFC